MFLSGIRSQPTGLLDILYSLWPPIRCHSFILFLGVASVSEAEIIPHYGPSSYPHCKAFFGLWIFHLVYTLLRSLGELLAAASTLLGTVKAFMGKLSGPSSWASPLSHCYFRSSCLGNMPNLHGGLDGGFLYVAPGYTLYSQAMILLFWDHLKLISDF